MNGETPVQNGGTATWSEGENTLTVTVENGTTKRVYTVTVNKGVNRFLCVLIMVNYVWNLLTAARGE